MPGQLKESVSYLLAYYTVSNIRTNRLRDQYAKEFHLFKPDKRLNWLPYLGTLKLDIELDDRTVSADVPPLEAACIELFSQKGKGLTSGFLFATC